jgi:hypothetical protein
MIKKHHLSDFLVRQSKRNRELRCWFNATGDHFGESFHLIRVNFFYLHKLLTVNEVLLNKIVNLEYI